MSLNNEIKSIVNSANRTTGKSQEAVITALGERDGRYTVRLKNGTLASGVIGESNLSVGSSVLVLSSAGRNPIYTIIAKGYPNSGIINTFYV